ncbi:11150_t:CDS:2, partial [Scutellospora calospora]
MDHLHSPTQKRPLIEEISLPTPDTTITPPDQQAKRLRLLLPTSVTFPQPPPNTFQQKFQLPIPPTLLESSTTNLSSRQQELPSIDSLGPLPPLPHFTPTTQFPYQRFFQQHNSHDYNSRHHLNKNEELLTFSSLRFERLAEENTNDDQNEELDLNSDNEDGSIMDYERINLQREPHLIVQNDEALNME